LGDWTIWNESFGASFLTTCKNYIGTKIVRECLESTVLHTMCPSEIHRSKFIVDVLYRPSLARSKMSNATRPCVLKHLQTMSLNFPHLKISKYSSNIHNNASNPE
jgi:hypothetical protein